MTEEEQAKQAQGLVIEMMNVLLRSNLFEVQMAALVGLCGECLEEMHVNPLFLLHRVTAWIEQRRLDLAKVPAEAPTTGGQ